jgi:hypothetical protein
MGVPAGAGQTVDLRWSYSSRTFCYAAPSAPTAALSLSMFASSKFYRHRLFTTTTSVVTFIIS